MVVQEKGENLMSVRFQLVMIRRHVEKELMLLSYCCIEQTVSHWQYLYSLYINWNEYSLYRR